MYQLPNGSYYTGLNPSTSAVPKGTFYPRSATLGGCVAHNALIMYYPLADDFDTIANLTKDDSWLATNMRKYFERLEDNQYLATGTLGHGFSGWLQMNRVEESVFLTDSKVYPMLKVSDSSIYANFTSC
jgi:choline dehydrogenase